MWALRRELEGAGVDFDHEPVAPHGQSERGWRTIEVCGLDRPGLLTLYKDHVNARVRPKLEPLFEAIRRHDGRAVVSAWSTATRGLLAPARPFRALSYDAIHVLVPADERRRYSLAADRP